MTVTCNSVSLLLPTRDGERHVTWVSSSNKILVKYVTVVPWYLEPAPIEQMTICKSFTNASCGHFVTFGVGSSPVCMHTRTDPDNVYHPWWFSGVHRTSFIYIKLVFCSIYLCVFKAKQVSRHQCIKTCIIAVGISLFPK